MTSLFERIVINAFTFPTTPYSILSLNVLILIPIIEFVRAGSKGLSVYSLFLILSCQVYGGGWAFLLWGLAFIYPRGKSIVCCAGGNKSDFLLNLWWFSILVPLLFRLSFASLPFQSKLDGSMAIKQIGKNFSSIGRVDPSDRLATILHNFPPGAFIVNGHGFPPSAEKLPKEHVSISPDPMLNDTELEAGYLLIWAVAPIVLGALFQISQEYFKSVVYSFEFKRLSAVQLAHLTAFSTSSFVHLYFVIFPWLSTYPNTSFSVTLSNNLSEHLVAATLILYIAGVWEVSFQRLPDKKHIRLTREIQTILITAIFIGLSTILIGPGATTIAIWFFREKTRYSQLLSEGRKHRRRLAAIVQHEPEEEQA